jgi:hypothetical protein
MGRFMGHKLTNNMRGKWVKFHGNISLKRVQKRYGLKKKNVNQLEIYQKMWVCDVDCVEKEMKYKQKYSREHRNIVKPNFYQ